MQQFTRRTSLLAYGVKCSERGIDPALAQHIEEQCNAHMRLCYTALNSYERFFRDPPVTLTNALLVWLFISSAYSSMDAAACIMRAVVKGEVPEKEKRLPMASDLATELRGTRLQAPLETFLTDQDGWFAHLREARHRILHRGFWPVHFASGWALSRCSGIFGFGKQGAELKPDYPLDLEKLALGIAVGIEVWEDSLRPLLRVERQILPVQEEMPIQITVKWEVSDFALPMGGFGLSQPLPKYDEPGV